MGELKGSFLVSSTAWERLAKLVEKERFFDLPKDIRKEAYLPHAPDLRLKITQGGKTKEVRLFDPDTITDASKKRRFMTVWNSLFEQLPVKPKW